MNSYFKAAIERYNKLFSKKQKENGGYLINPISEVDSEIIIELKELLKKAGFDQVTEALREYKGGIKDLDILDGLRQCNLDIKDKRLEEEGGEFNHKEETVRYREFIELNGDKLDVHYIFGYHLKDLSDFNQEEYQIIINPIDIDLTTKPLFSNRKFTFLNGEEFKEAIYSLDKQLREAKIKFVNKGKLEEDD